MKPEMALDMNPTEAATPRTLLVVDDEAHVRSALTRLLRRDGYRILEAGSADEGLALLALHPVQVVLSDQRMPGAPGTEFLGKVQERYPQTIRLLLTGHAASALVAAALEQRAVHRFFAKPWDNEGLRQHIREAFCDHQQIHGPANASAAAANAAERP